MPLSFDVAVLGGGITGVSAALAAQLRGARTCLIRGAPGATALASGAWSGPLRPELRDAFAVAGLELSPTRGALLHERGQRVNAEFAASTHVGATADGPAWSVGLQLSFPIFDGLRTRGRVAQTRSDYKRLQIEEARQVDAIALETSDALNAVREAEEIVNSMSGTVSQAERLLAMSEKGYILGVKIRLEVDDAELNLLQAKGNLSRAKRNYLLSLTQLDWVRGVLGEKPAP